MTDRRETNVRGVMCNLSIDLQTLADLGAARYIR